MQHRQARTWTRAWPDPWQEAYYVAMLSLQFQSPQQQTKTSGSMRQTHPQLHDNQQQHRQDVAMGHLSKRTLRPQLSQQRAGS
jgi:hypothetical protein